jgi:nucleotide-binding universal stress UspA family protein
MRPFTLRTIVVPTDFSDTSAPAFLAAARLAEAFDSEVVVVHCALPIPTEVGYPGGALTTSFAENEVNLLERLQSYADERLSDGVVPYSVRVIHEGPICGINRVAEEVAADLIVMSTHGRTGWKRAVLGSVSEGVMRSASKPVLTIQKEFRWPLMRILCPVNFSAAARNALDHAAALAEAFDAELLVVHVLEMDHHLLIDEQPRAERWLPEEVRERCRFVEFVERGEAPEEIVGLARRTDCSLIVLGAEHRRFGDRSVVSATSEEVVRHSDVPVLTIVAPLVADEAETESGSRQQLSSV